MAIIVVLQQHLGDKTSASDGYELSTYGAPLQWMEKNMRSVTTSEYLSGQARGAVIDGVRNEDIQSLTFADDSFDVLTSNQVFEHVPDDIAGFRESYRVLRPCGAMILTVPLYDTPSTEQKAVVQKGEIIFNGEPEYHDSRADGAASVPVFWRHSMNDICSRVMSAGFTRAELREVKLAEVQRSPALVVYTVK